jgi:hypothetical protein
VNFILIKKFKHRATADVIFILIACNLRRILNIIGLKEFGKYVKGLSNDLKSTVLSSLNGFTFFDIYFVQFSSKVVIGNTQLQGSGYFSKFGINGGF